MAPLPRPELVSAQIPSNGALLITQLGGVTLTAVTVTDAMGHDVPGLLTTLTGDLAVWQPTTAFDANASYTLMVNQFQSPAPLSFSTVDVASRDAPTLTAAETLEPEMSSSTGVCCTPVFPDSIGGGNCFPVQTITTATLNVMLTNTLSQAERSQFVVRAAPSPLPSSAVLDNFAWVPLTSNNSLPMSFSEQAAQYCMTVQIMNIVTRTAMTIPTLDPACQPQGSLPMLGTSDIDLVAAGSLAHDVCQLPPAGLEKTWCQVNAACSSMRTAAGCEGYAHVCEGAPLPMPEAGTGGSSGAAGTLGAAGESAGTGGTGEPMTASDGGVATDDGAVHVKACSCSTPGSLARDHAPSGGWLALAGLSMIGWRSSRRRRGLRIAQTRERS